MEALFGQTQRNMLMFLSGGTRSFSVNCLYLRRFHSFGTARFHTSTWSRNNGKHDSGPLTLSSIGLGNEVEATDHANVSKADILTSSTWANSDRVGTKRSQDKVVLGVEEIKVPKDYRSSKIELSSKTELLPGKAKTVKTNRFKADHTKQTPVVDTAVFAATSFSELDLSPLLIKRLTEEGISAPTEVQCTAIPTISKNHDVVMQSYTGSGKTFAYLLPILSKIGPLKKPEEEEVCEFKQGIEAVIIAPSRELGMQIVREAEKLLGPVDKKIVQQLVGGANRSRQEEALRKNKPVIVVGTPGRIAEISAAGKLHTHGCRFLVLDEVDQLLSFNFREDMHRILEHVGRKSGSQTNKTSQDLIRRAERQLIMVSATVPLSVLRAARSWGKDPFLVKAKSVAPLDSVSTPGTTSISASDTTASIPSPLTQAAVDSLPPALEHYYCVSKAQHKVDTLRRCVHALDAKSVIAFMNHTKQLKDVVFKLEARGMKSAALHGDLGKLGRSTTLKNFRNGKVRVLVTNELSARGLDILDCDLVVNLDLPTDSVHYAHRAGRTGRLGRKGYVVTIVEEREVFVVNKLRRQLGVPIQSCEFTDAKLVICKESDQKTEIEAVG